MIENEVNTYVEKWLTLNGYSYKGVNNNKAKSKAPRLGSDQAARIQTSQIHSESTTDDIITKDVGYGQILVPAPMTEDDARTRVGVVLLDHQGVRDREHEIIWVEAKGSGVGMSQLLEGFIRLVYGCYWGGGSGLLAIPTAECSRMLEQRDFLRRVGVSCERMVGILDAEKGDVHWLT